MTFKELKVQRINKTKILLDLTKNIVDEYSEKIAQLNIKLLQTENLNWTSTVEDYLDIIYDALEKIYALTLEHIRKIYEIEILNETITEKDVNKLTYSDDNLTLEQRVYNHCEEYNENIPSKERLLYDMIKILNTEALCIMNNLIANKIEFEYAAVESDGGCCDLCSEYIDQDYIPINEFEEPPYHPNCECIAVYFTSDEIED